MNPLGVISAGLQSIPAAVRKWILLGYAVVVVVVQLLLVIDVDLDYDTINEVLVILGGYLGFQSAANVTDGDGEVESDAG